MPYTVFPAREDVLSHRIIGAAIEVHRTLGPGLMESAYEACLAYEFERCNIFFERQKPLPVCYKGALLDCGYRMDFVVDGCVLVELKAVEQLTGIHDAQVLTYLKLGGYKLGLLINFNVYRLNMKGIRRLVLDL